MVTDWEADPPGPVHVRSNVDVVLGETCKLPDVFWFPDHVPLATQDVAFVAPQVTVLWLPLVIELGFAEIETTGDDDWLIGELVVEELIPLGGSPLIFSPCEQFW